MWVNSGSWLMTLLSICAAIFMIIVLIWIFLSRQEDFVSKQTKAQQILEWYGAGGDSYDSFRRGVAESDIVDYATVVSLKKQNKLSFGALMRELL